VWLLGPVVKNAGFGTLLWAMALIASCTVLVVLALPREDAAP
jgi:predicted MFS family arabinose efflux permease